jgi:preprotein translocase subunit SecE
VWLDFGFDSVIVTLVGITWPTRKETTMTTVMVFVMVAILSLFFFLVDQILSYGIKVLLG